MVKLVSEKTSKIVKATAPILAERGREITSYFYKTMFNDHPELLHLFNHANQEKGRQQAALANTIYAAATAIDQLDVLVPVVRQIAHKHRSLHVKKEHYPIVGEYLVRAIKDVLGEEATTEIVDAWKEAYTEIAQVFIQVEEDLYKEAREKAWEGFKTFRITRKKEESSVITSFYLEAEDGLQIPSFLPGQYVTLRLPLSGEPYLFNRQYSLSDAYNEKYLRISVKREGDEDRKGKVSHYLHDVLQEGDLIEITAPAGDFVLDQSTTPVYLISGGVGITPMMSMLNDLSTHQSDRHVTFIHASRNQESHAFKQEVTSLLHQIEHGKQVVFYDVLPPITKDDTSHEGPLDVEKLSRILSEKQGVFYICGPIPFMKSVIHSLHSLGVKKEAIRYEFFGPSLQI